MKNSIHTPLLAIAIFGALLGTAGAGEDRSAKDPVAAPPADFFGSGFELNLKGIYEGGKLDPHSVRSTKTERTVTEVFNPAPQNHHENRDGGGDGGGGEGVENARVTAKAVSTTSSTSAAGTTTRTVETSRKTSSRRVFAHNAGGVGLDGAYFFTRNFGLDLGVAWVDADRDVFELSASAIYRMPFMVARGRFGVAPYVLAGADGLFGHRSVAAGHVGGGLEVRLCKHVGIYAEGRWVIGGEGVNFGTVQSGLRFAF